MTKEEAEARDAFIMEVYGEIHDVIREKHLTVSEVAHLASALLADASYQVAVQHEWDEEQMLVYGGKLYAESLGTVVAYATTDLN